MKGAAKKSDELQDMLNKYVLEYDLGINEGQCIFKLDEIRDEEKQKKITVGGHGCKDYGINLDLYVRNDDWGEKKEREFRYRDDETGQLKENTRTNCMRFSSYTKCRYYLAPRNNRVGFL